MQYIVHCMDVDGMQDLLWLYHSLLLFNVILMMPPRTLGSGHTGQKQNIDPATQTVDTFLCENFESVSDENGPLMEMEAQDLLKILLSDDLSVQSEESVFNCVSNCKTCMVYAVWWPVFQGCLQCYSNK